MSEVALLFGSETAVSPEQLDVAGFAPFSTADWPGRLVATIFTQGCPWRCSYCQNPSLQPFEGGAVRWSTVRSHLAARAGKLDGVVFSGGEPTAQAALVPAMQEVRSMGFEVGLLSAGVCPERLGAALRHADWLALDIKAMPEGYEDITGRSGSGAKAWESLRIAIAWGGPLEVRITVDPTSHSREAVLSAVRTVQAMGGPVPVLQEARESGTSEEFRHALGGRGLADVIGTEELPGVEIRG